MASPVSIGDGILLTNLAYRLILALTAGRSSAPKEFATLEAHLKALHSALKAVAEHSAGSSSFLKPILADTKITLQLLERFIESYSIISTPPTSENSSAPTLSKLKWTKTLRKNWMRVKWATEGAEISELRDKLLFHVHCLQLGVAAVNEGRTQNVETLVQEVNRRMGELQIQQSTSTTQIVIGRINIDSQSAGGTQNVIQEAPRTYQNKPTFRLERDVDGSNERELVCPRAAISLDWIPPGTRTSAQPSSRPPRVFVCLCRAKDDIDNFREEHDSSGLADIYLTPESYVIHLTGRARRWAVHPTGDRQSARMRTVYIRDVAASHIDKFERKFVSRLNVSVARRTLESRQSPTRFIRYSSNPNGHRAEFLHCMDDTSFSMQTMAVRFPGRDEEVAAESLYLLYYRSLPIEMVFRDDKIPPSAYTYPPAAGLNIQFETSGAPQAISIPIGVSRPLIQQSRRSLSLSYDDGIEAMKITLGDSASAASLSQAINDISHELLIVHHSLPRAEEIVLLDLYVGDVMIGHKYTLYSATVVILGQHQINSSTTTNTTSENSVTRYRPALVRILLYSAASATSFSRENIPLDESLISSIEHGGWMQDAVFVADGPRRSIEASMVGDVVVRDPVQWKALKDGIKKIVGGNQTEDTFMSAKGKEPKQHQLLVEQ